MGKVQDAEMQCHTGLQGLTDMDGARQRRGSSPK